MIGFIYTAIVIVIRGTEIVVERGDISDVKLFNWGYDALFAIPIVVFGFNCHANVVTIFSCAAVLPLCLFPSPGPVHIISAPPACSTQCCLQAEACTLRLATLHKQ